MNLFEKIICRLLGEEPPGVSQVRVFTTRRYFTQRTYHITDLEGREIELDRQDAVAAAHALQAALKVYK